MLKRFHFSGDGREFIKQDIALYLGQSINTTALPLIGRVSTLLKKSVYLSNASLSMKRLLPSALSIVLIIHYLFSYTYMSIVRHKNHNIPCIKGDELYKLLVASVQILVHIQML